MKKVFFNFDGLLIFVLIVVLAVSYAKVLPEKTSDWLLILAVAIGTIPVFLSAFRSLKNKKISIDLLASAALVFSILAKEWESAAFINLMLASARIFADYTENRSRRAIAGLLKLKPHKAKIIKNGELIEVAVESIKKGDLAVVELGERIPVDGIIEKGEASVDQSSLTGESAPVEKTKGDEVFTSTIVVSGNIIVKTEKTGKETTFEKIIKLVEESQLNKPKINGLVDKFTSRYIIATFLVAGLLYVFSAKLDLILSLLLVTCADDIAVALPLSFLSAIGYAARRGVIIKGGNFIEILARLKTVILDKTGTLTRGRLKVEEIVAFGEYKEDEILGKAAVASYFSNHPSSRAILKRAKELKISLKEPKKFQEISGKGTSAFYNGKKIIIGKESFFRELKIKINKNQLAEMISQKNRGLNVTLVGLDKKLIGFIVLGDELRPGTKETIAEMRKLGVGKIVMLTGDNEKIAARVAEKTGIEEFHANLMPQDKLDYIKKHQESDTKLAMIGDGVNDAAALTLADVGIAMGTIGSDAAIEAADVALMKDDLSRLPEIMELSKYTVKVARQDFWIWGIVNVVGLVLVFAKILTPAGAAAFNFLTDFIPLFNSMRVFGFHFSSLSSKITSKI